MKNSDIIVGRVYPIGVRRGRGQVVPTGKYGKVERKGFPHSNYGGRSDGVLITFWDRESDSPVLIEDNEANRKWNSENIGKPRTKTLTTKEILDPEVAAERERKEREERERRERIFNARQELELSTRDRILKILDLPEGTNGVTVHTRWDVENECAFVHEITFHNDRDDGINHAADALLAMGGDDEQDE